MRFDDDAPTPSSDPAGDAGRSRRRSARPWSNQGPAGDRPVSDSDWAAPPSLTRTRPPVAPPVLPTTAAPTSTGSTDLGPVLDQLRAMQAQITALQAAVTVPPPPVDSALVTGDELAASIELLGNTLGGGMATLLTEHRNLLARDVSTAADRILEEVGVRLRAAATQTIDGVEERVRHVVSRSLAEMSEQVDLRLDKIVADVTGLRAVMLEIPDQAAVTDRLDQLADSIANARTKEGGGTARMSPALAGAIEKTVAGSMEQIEESVHSVVEVVRELLEERLPEDLAESLAEAAGGERPAATGGGDGEALQALTAEVKALRRRISLRSGGSDDVDLDALAEKVAPLLVDPPAPSASVFADDEDADEAEDDLAIEIEAPPAPKARATRTARAAKDPEPPARGRRSRRIT